MRLTAVKTKPISENGSRSEFIETRENNTRTENNPVTNVTYGQYFIR